MENFCSDLFFIFVCIVLIFFALVMLYIIDFREFNKIFKPMMFFFICSFDNNFLYASK